MIYRFGLFALDVERYELTRDGEPIAVEPRPLEVLADLLAHADRVVRKEELIDRVWGGRFVSDSALTRAVREARRALGDGAAESSIRTVYGRGYRFTGPVETEGEGGGAEACAEAAAAPPDHAPDARVARSAPAAPPLPLTPLVGRAREVAEIRRLLGACRLLTVTGAPGSGKTRVAIEASRAAAADFPEGVAWVGLAEVRDAEAVLPELTRALRLADRPGRDPLDTLTAGLAERRLLLVVDNFEQVLPCAPRLAELARRAPRLVLLVTSRFVLGVEGEQEYPLATLPVPAEAESDPAALAASPAVTLFLDRARAARPGLVATDATLCAAGRLVRRLDGLPLAIELAAARVRLLTPAEILDRLGSRLDLASRATDRPARHQTLRQSLAWSLDLLSGAERACLGRLAVFVGGFTLDAAAEVACGADDGMALLAALVDKSLVERLGSGGPGGSRFSLLEATREIAAERLAERPEEEAAVRRRHAAWCRTLAERAEPVLAGGEAQIECLARLDVEHGNLLAALDHAAASGEIETGLATAAAMWRWWSARGAYREGFERLQALVDHPTARSAAASPARVRGLAALGALAFLLCDFATAKLRLGEGLELARERGDRGAEADLLAHLGWACGETGELDRAHQLSARALELHRASGALRGQAAALNNLGWLALYRDEVATAERLLRANLELRHRSGDRRGEIMALATLSWIDRAPERLAERRALTAGARRLAARVDDRPLGAYTRSAEGLLALDEGDPAAARRAFAEGVAFFREVGHDFGVGWFHTHDAEALLAAGDREAARRALDEADVVWRRLGNAWGTRRTARLRRRAGGAAE